jgi:hypothetical protein
MFASIFAASMGLMCLGYVSVYGGQSDSASNTAQAMAGNHDDSLWSAQVALSGGFGESTPSKALELKLTACVLR